MLKNTKQIDIEAALRLKETIIDSDAEMIRFKTTVRSFIGWAMQHIPSGLSLPDDCQINTPSGRFEQSGAGGFTFGTDQATWSREALDKFATLIVQGWLERLIAQMAAVEERLVEKKKNFSQAAQTVESFLNAQSVKNENQKRPE